VSVQFSLVQLRCSVNGDTVANSGLSPNHWQYSAKAYHL